MIALAWAGVVKFVRSNLGEVLFAAALAALIFGAIFFHRYAVAASVAAAVRAEGQRVEAVWKDKLAASEAETRQRLSGEADAAYRKGIEEATARAEAAAAARSAAEETANEIVQQSDTARTCLVDRVIAERVNRLR